MFRENPRGEIAPYLEADYWGGKMIGENGLLSPPAAERPSWVQPAIGGQDIAMSSLERVFNDRSCLAAKAIYLNGEVFTPEDHPPGAIVLYRKEVLLKDPEKAAKLEGAPNQKQLPFGASFTRAPKAHGNGNVERYIQPPFVYYCGERVGVVAQKSGKDSPRELMYISTFNQLRSKNGKTTGFPKTSIERAPFAVGQTRRYVTKRGAEFMIRVNAVEVYGIDDKPIKKKVEKPKPSPRDALDEFLSPRKPYLV